MIEYTSRQSAKIIHKPLQAFFAIHLIQLHTFSVNISEVETNIHTGLEPVPGVPGGGVPVAPYIVHDCPYVGIPITILSAGIP